MSPSRVPDDVREQIRAEADNRCGYCLSPQRLVLGQLEIEHILPVAAGGSEDQDNLWLACRMCNNFKGVQTEAVDPESGQRVALFNPRQQRWTEHFAWSDDATRIVGRTSCGRATIIALQLNNLIAVTVRRQWVTAGWHPPAGI